MWRRRRVGDRGGRRNGGFLLRRSLNERFLGKDAKDEDGTTCADFVAVGEGGFFYAGAVEESAIAAVEIADAATAGIACESTVDTGHARVVGEGVFGFVGAADAQGLAGG